MAYIGLGETFKVTVEEDPETGDLFITLPEELCDHMDIHPGDEVE